MSSDARPLPPRGALEYFLGPRAASTCLVLARNSAEDLRRAIASQYPAALLLSDEDPDPSLLSAAKAQGMAILGPGGAAHVPSLPGKVAFVTQRSELVTAILDWGQRQQVAFSAILSLGRSSTITLGEAIDYLAEDPYTKSILLYIESIDDASAFLSAARECALSKPVIVLRVGREDRQQDAVFDAAFRRSGVLRVQRLAELFYLAEVLDRQPRPAGDRLAILTNARGPALTAADALALLNNHAAAIVQTSPDAYEAEFQRLQASAANDAILAIFAPQPGLDPNQIAQAIARHASKRRKPVLASFLGADLVADAKQTLAAASIPTFPYPDTAARAFQTLWQYASNLRALYETPIFAADLIDASTLDASLRSSRARGRETVEPELLARVLSAYGIPLDSREAKVTQPLRLRSEIDATFGPVLYLSAAGFGEEVYNDLTAALPPLTATLARRFVERLRVHQAFRDDTLLSLEVLLVKFSRLINELPILRQVEIFPLCSEAGRAWAGGARATLQPAELAESLWPRSVIRPYPSQYVREIQLRDGSHALLRPIRPEDETKIADFHNGLSERTVYLRYLQFLKFEERISHERLARVCFNDYSRELALVVEQNEAILGVGRLQRNPLRRSEAEVAFLVRDQSQGQGIGKALVENIIAVARAEGLERLTAELLSDNTPMRTLLERQRFQTKLASDGQTLRALLPL
jgi:acetyltransferase